MNVQNLQQFLIDSNAAGYAGGEEKKWIKEPNGSTTIPFILGEFSSHDNFFGGEPYGGRVIVSYKQKPVWMMVYYGWVTKGIDTAIIYPILRTALKNMPKEAPFRGPRELSIEEYVYKNTWTGIIEQYSGEECIIQGDTLLYTANYMGGLVDTRAGV